MADRVVVSIFLVVGLALSSMVLGVPNTVADGTTWFVDKSLSDPRCENTTITSIQAAINAASSGDTIIVCPETYSESLTIDKSLTIQGFGREGVDATYLQSSGNPAVKVDADYVNFTHFNVSYSSTLIGIHVNYSDTVNISHNTIRLIGGGAYNVLGDFSFNVTIDDNLIYSESQLTGGAGVIMYNENETGAADPRSSTNVVSNSTIWRFGFGIYLQNSSTNILNNTISSIHVDAIDVYHGDSSPIIKGNKIFYVGLSPTQQTGTGIQLEDANATIESNTIYDIAVVGIDVSPNPIDPCNGLIPECRSSATIVGNEVYDVGNRPGRPRIDTDTMAVGFTRVDWSNFTGNEIYNSTFGILLRDQSYAEIVKNGIHENGDGIVSERMSHPLIANNTIHNNTNGIYVVGNGSALRPTIEYNDLWGNVRGIYLNGRWGSQYLNLQQNSIRTNTYGFYSLASGFNTVGNNSFENNTYGLYFDTHIDQPSGRLYHPSHNLVEFNVIANNTYGIYGNASLRNTFQQNNISNNQYGVFLNGPDGGRNNVSFNNISQNSVGGVYLSNSHVDEIIRNNITQNAYGVFLFSSHGWIYNNTISANSVDGIHVENVTGNHTWFFDTFENIKKVEKPLESMMTVNTTISCGDAILESHYLPRDDFSGSSLDPDVWKTSVGENAQAYLDTVNDAFVVDTNGTDEAAFLFNRYPIQSQYQVRTKMKVTEVGGENHSIGLVGRFYNGTIDLTDYFHGKCPCIGELNLPTAEWYQAIRFTVDYYQGVSKSGIRIIYNKGNQHFFIWNFANETWNWYNITTGFDPAVWRFNETDWLVEYPLGQTFEVDVVRYTADQIHYYYNFTLYNDTGQMIGWANTSLGKRVIYSKRGDYLAFGDPYTSFKFQSGITMERYTYDTYGNGHLIIDSVNTTMLQETPTSGNLTSVRIDGPPDGWMWASVELNKSEPTDTWINVSVLDGSTKNPILGFADRSESKIELDEINRDAHPTIYVQAYFKGTTDKTPRLYDWLVTVHSGISKNLVEQNSNSGISVHLSTGVVNISLNQVNDNIFAGIEVNASSNQRIIESDISEGGYGVILVDTMGIVVKGNVINHSPTTSIEGSVTLKRSHSGLFERNEVSSGYVGIWMTDSNTNTFRLNSITNHTKEGVYLYGGSLNLFYWNNFFWNNVATGPTSQAYDRTCPCSNFWDAGYPTGGNYWSDYTGLDRFSGPNQNQYGSDGIGDTPYFIPVCAYDYYPLMSPK